jgi:aerobic carbon-monoxide dehydrogenase small subunit
VADVPISLTVNGELCSIVAPPCRTLQRVLHDDLGIVSVKEGCGQGDCGSCIVIMDGLAVNSCLVLAAQADGAEILTLEGLASATALHPLQLAFADEGAFQCGYCTAGMIMSCYALLHENPDPSAEDVRRAISGNLCRCTNYSGVERAVSKAARGLAPHGDGARTL